MENLAKLYTKLVRNVNTDNDIVLNNILEQVSLFHRKLIPECTQGQNRIKWK